MGWRHPVALNTENCNRMQQWWWWWQPSDVVPCMTCTCSACAFIYCLVFQWGSSQQMYQIPIWICEYIHRYLNRTALFARKFSDIFDISITIIVEAVILDCQKKHVHWAPLWHHGSFHWGIGHRRQMISAFIDVLVIPLLNYCTRFLPTVPILCIHLVQLHNSELI